MIRDQLQSLFKFIGEENKKNDEIKNEMKRFKSIFKLMGDLDEEVDGKSEEEDDEDDDGAQIGGAGAQTSHSIRKKSTQRLHRLLTTATMQHQDNDEKEGKSWLDWRKTINQNNRDLYEQLKDSNREELQDLTYESSNLPELTDVQKSIASSRLSSILEDHKEVTEMNEATVEEDKRWYGEFANSFTKVPKWWSDEHGTCALPYVSSIPN